MRIDDVTKALCGGSKSAFKNGDYEAMRFVDRIQFYLGGHKTAIVPIDGWTEVKPQREWSEKEMWMFKNISENIGWIATDSDNRVYGFSKKPIKGNDGNYYSSGAEDSVRLDKIFDFITVTKEESPVSISMIRRENN